MKETKPLFPVYVVNTKSQEMRIFDDPQDLESNMEFLNTDNEEDAAQYLVLDAEKRRVRLILEFLQLKVFELTELQPKDEDVRLLGAVAEIDTPP